MAATGVYDKAIRKNLNSFREWVTTYTKTEYLCEYVHKCEHMKAC